MNDSTLVHRGPVILDLIINHTRLLHLISACVLINTKLLYNFISPLIVLKWCISCFTLSLDMSFEQMWSMCPNVSIYVLIEYLLLKSGGDAFQSRCAFVLACLRCRAPSAGSLQPRPAPSPDITRCGARSEFMVYSAVVPHTFIPTGNNCVGILIWFQT